MTITITNDKRPSIPRKRANQYTKVGEIRDHNPAELLNKLKYIKICKKLDVI